MQKYGQYLKFGEYVVNVSEILYFWKRSNVIQGFLRGQIIPLISNMKDPAIEFERIWSATDLVWLGDYLINPDNMAYAWQRESDQVQAFAPGFPIPLCGHLHDDRLKKIWGLDV